MTNQSEAARSETTMALTTLPRNGEGTSVLTRDARLGGHVADRADRALTVALDATLLPRTIELEFVGAPERAERRTGERVDVEVPISVWSLSQPTRRLEGKTVNLSVGGAQLWLPELAPFVATLELRVRLPSGVMSVGAVVRWRGDPELVGVQFDRITPGDQGQLLEFLGV